MGKRYTLIVDGTTYETEVNGGSVMVDGQMFSVETNGQDVTVNGTRFTVELADGQALVNGIPHTVRRGQVNNVQMAGEAKSPARTAPSGDDASFVKAIMPGKVLQVLVSEGDAVKDGDVVLILEAMKMENEIRAHRSGTVKALYAENGADVEMGQVLLEIA